MVGHYQLPSDRDQFCQLAYSFRQNSTIVGLAIMQALISFVSLIFLYLILFQSRELRRIWSIIELNLKIITVVGVFFYVLSTFNSLGLFVYKSVILLLDFEPCFYVWSGLGCFAMQSMYSGNCVVAHAMFHFALLVERCHVAFSNQKRRFRGFVGIILAVLIVVCSPLPQLNFMDGNDLYEPRPYCAFILPKADPKGLSSAYFTIVFDCLITLGDICLFFYNKRKIVVHKTKPNGFDLHRSFRLRSMEISIKFIWPFSVVHSLTYSAQILVYALWVRPAMNWSIEGTMLFYECTNFARVLANLILFAFVYFYSRSFEKRPESRRVIQNKEFDLHFKEFERIIS